jgi:hypothetical protein
VSIAKLFCDYDVNDSYLYFKVENNSASPIISA